MRAADVRAAAAMATAAWRQRECHARARSMRAAAAMVVAAVMHACQGDCADGLLLLVVISSVLLLMPPPSTAASPPFRVSREFAPRTCGQSLKRWACTSSSPSYRMRILPDDECERSVLNDGDGGPWGRSERDGGAKDGGCLRRCEGEVVLGVVARVRSEALEGRPTRVPLSLSSFVM